MLMDLPKINANLSQPFALFVGSIILSYFSHVGWWSLAGLSFVIGAYFSGFPSSIGLTLSRLFLIISGILFVFAIIVMRWFWL